MLVDFNELPNTARVWVYQANRSLTADEIAQIVEKLEMFVTNWKRHGDDLKASFQIKYNQFVVLAVDESFNNVSGCSIDASVSVIKELQQEFDIDLLNKMNIAFKDGDTINIVSMQQFKEFAKADKITKDTLVFNNMVNSKADLATGWEVPASQSWHARFLN